MAKTSGRSKARKRTLADDLLEMSTAVPAAEPTLEDAPLGDEAQLLESDEELADTPARKKSKKAPEKAMRMRPAVDANDSDLEGITVSRKDAFGARTDSEEEGSSEAEQGSSDDEELSERLSGEDVGSEGQDTSSSAGDQGSGLSNEEDMEEDESQDTGSSDRLAAEIGSREEDMGRQEEDEMASLQQQMRERTAKESAKGAATRNQQALWDKILEMRILLQKSLSASQQMPTAQDLHAVKAFSTDCSASLKAIKEELSVSLRELIDLQSSMVEHGSSEHSSKSNDQTGILQKDATPKQLWDAIDTSYVSISDFRDTSLDRWYKKSLLGGAFTLKGNLQTLSQSVSAQVLNLMKGNDKMIKRSQPDWQSLPHRLCSRAGPSNRVGPDAETFDDTDFYQQLLREFLEASSAGVSLEPSAGLKKKKLKPARDRKGSKGRRLRYDVQEKLVNFMAPRQVEEPAIASQLFRNLFAHNK